ncbi:epidermal growth factor-like protein 8 [Lycorma delicatula]|uniref:epidermal growth factor-like protein 8 n=1 Tax=Lycorma delicatula TaxID=130591 RepID=UPI003F50F122
MQEIFVIILFLCGIYGEPYTRFHSGRHVCTLQKAVVEPIKTVETFRQPRMQTYSEPCQKGKTCRGFRITYGTGYRNVYKHRIRRQINYICCPGWVQDTKLSYGCNKDVNECAEKSPCDHSCINTFGSYRCTCRTGYVLQSDGHTCRWNDRSWPSVTGTGTDVYESDVDVFAKNMAKLNEVFKSNRNELSTEVSDNPTNSELLAMIDTLQQKVDSLLRYHNEKWKKVETYVAELQYLCNRVETLENQFNFHKSCL